MSKSIQLINNNNEKIFPNPHFPVGSIYLSVLNTNPKVWFGGKWELIAKGRTLVGVNTDDTDFDEAKKTGGEKSHRLLLTELPGGVIGGEAGNKSWAVAPWDNYSNWAYVTTSVDDVNNASTHGTCNQPHNNMQPYFTCFIWCRIA